MKLFRQSQVADPFRYVAGWNERRSQTGWWHSFDLPDGTHIPGVCLIDGLKKRINKFPIPQDLRGKRALDVGTWDGWFAFELERRGAEVVATDVWHNPRFLEMRERLGSKVRYERLNVYDMSPERLGKFDIVLFFGVLYHLKHPLLALERVCELTTEMAAVDSFALRNQHFPGADDKAILEFYESDEMGGQTDNWVGPSVKAIEAMCRTAGFPRAEFQGFTDHSACFACYRHWEPAGRSDPPELLSAFHHTDYGVNFRRSTEEYVTIWFKHPPSLQLAIPDVKPSIEGFGVRPIAVNRLENDIWQASLMVPPGLDAGWNKVDVRVGRSAASNSLSIALDMPLDCESLEITGVADGKTWIPNELDLAQGHQLSVWVAGLPENADHIAVEASINGVPAEVAYVEPPTPAPARQVNLLVPGGSRAGSASVQVKLRSVASPPAQFEIRASTAAAPPAG